MPPPAGSQPGHWLNASANALLRAVAQEWFTPSAKQAKTSYVPAAAVDGQQKRDHD